MLSFSLIISLSLALSFVCYTNRAYAGLHHRSRMRVLEARRISDREIDLSHWCKQFPDSEVHVTKFK